MNYLNKSRDLLKNYMTKIIREWSYELSHSGLKENSSKLVWSQTFFFSIALKCSGI